MTDTQKSSKTSPDDEILEGAIFTVKQTRHLKVIVIVMGLMLIFGFIALAIAVMNKASKRNSALKAAASVEQPLTHNNKATPQNLEIPTAFKGDITPDLPKDAKILSYKMNGAMMILHLKSKLKNQIIVLDMVSGKIKSKIHLPQ